MMRMFPGISISCSQAGSDDIGLAEMPSSVYAGALGAGFVLVIIPAHQVRKLAHVTILRRFDPRQLRHDQKPRLGQSVA